MYHHHKQIPEPFFALVSALFPAQLNITPKIVLLIVKPGGLFYSETQGRTQKKRQNHEVKNHLPASMDLNRSGGEPVVLSIMVMQYIRKSKRFLFKPKHHIPNN